jgi:hypothetical protein
MCNTHGRKSRDTVPERSSGTVLNFVPEWAGTSFGNLDDFFMFGTGITLGQDLFYVRILT